MGNANDRVRALRLKRGYTQAQLAYMITKQTGVSLTRSQLSNIELGDRDISNDLLEAFADFFDTSIDDLMGREEISIHTHSKGSDPAISEIEFALSGEIHDLTESEMQDVLDYVRFKRARREAKP